MGDRFVACQDNLALSDKEIYNDPIFQLFLRTHTESTVYSFSILKTCWIKLVVEFIEKNPLCLADDIDAIEEIPNCVFHCVKPIVPLSQYVNFIFQPGPSKKPPPPGSTDVIKKDHFKNAPFLTYTDMVQNAKDSANGGVYLNLNKFHDGELHYYKDESQVDIDYLVPPLKIVQGGIETVILKGDLLRPAKILTIFRTGCCGKPVPFYSISVNVEPSVRNTLIDFFLKLAESGRYRCGDDVSLTALTYGIPNKYIPYARLQYSSINKAKVCCTDVVHDHVYKVVNDVCYVCGTSGILRNPNYYPLCLNCKHMMWPEKELTKFVKDNITRPLTNIVVAIPLSSSTIEPSLLPTIESITATGSSSLTVVSSLPACSYSTTTVSSTIEPSLLPTIAPIADSTSLTTVSSLLACSSDPCLLPTIEPIADTGPSLLAPISSLLASSTTVPVMQFLSNDVEIINVPQPAQLVLSNEEIFLRQAAAEFKAQKLARDEDKSILYECVSRHGRKVIETRMDGSCFPHSAEANKSPALGGDNSATIRTKVHQRMSDSSVNASYADMFFNLKTLLQDTPQPIIADTYEKYVLSVKSSSTNFEEIEIVCFSDIYEVTCQIFSRKGFHFIPEITEVNCTWPILGFGKLNSYPEHYVAVVPKDVVSLVASDATSSSATSVLTASKKLTIVDVLMDATTKRTAVKIFAVPKSVEKGPISSAVTVELSQSLIHIEKECMTVAAYWKQDFSQLNASWHRISRHAARREGTRAQMRQVLQQNLTASVAMDLDQAVSATTRKRTAFNSTEAINSDPAKKPCRLAVAE